MRGVGQHPTNPWRKQEAGDGAAPHKSLAKTRGRGWGSAPQTLGENKKRGVRGARGVIYNTNIKPAYQAGRYQQMQTLRKTRPYWRYVHGDSANPRAQHLAWDGLVLPAEDAFWQTPSNGWGCSCRVEALSARDLRALKKTGPDKAPAIKTYAWKDARGGLHQIPVGIDPGWDYNVGEAAMGRGLAQKAAQAPQTGRMWQRLTKGDWQSAGRPEQVPLDRPKASLAAHVGSAAALKSVLQKALGGEEKVFALKQGDFTHRVLVNAEGLGSHLAAGGLERTHFFTPAARGANRPLRGLAGF